MILEFLTMEGRRVLFSFKTGSVSVSLNEVEVYSFDLEGRPLTFWIQDQTFVRTLDNRIIKKWRDLDESPSWKRISELGNEEKQRLLNQSWSRMHELQGLFQSQEIRLSGKTRIEGSSAEQACEWLNKVLLWNYDRLESERERFLSVYSPVSILPPDQYLSLVLQATEGCHWNRCTFCDFYSQTRFRIKSEDEFDSHITAVKRFFGEGLKLRRSIFLGDANALVIAQTRLLQIFDQVNKCFAIGEKSPEGGSDEVHRFEGIYSFIDAFTGDKKSEADLRQLKERNLRRVYLGIETGCDELLMFLNKPATARQALDVIKTIKKAGLSVGVIILIGVGGDRFYQRHVQKTTELINAMELGHGDLVYFSPLYESDNTEYRRRSVEQGIRPLTAQERQSQLKEIRSKLKFSGDNKPKISTYDIREFVY